MDWKKEAMIHIEMEIERKIGSGMEKRDAVYAVKRELAKISKPLEAEGHYRKAIDAVQKDMSCTLDKALIQLKLMVRERYADESVWN